MNRIANVSWISK